MTAIASATLDAHTIATRVVDQLRGILESDIAQQPRTLQTALGPSEIGTACDRCLIHKIAGTPTVEEDGVPWLPALGNAVHEYFDMALTRHMLTQMRSGATDFGEWVTEGKVSVGDINGVEITGHSDVFHVPTGTVIDYKIVGTTTLRKILKDASRTSLTYQRQAHLYGRGWQRKGYTVRAVAIWFVPRNGFHLDQGRTFTAPYDEQVAVDALARAERFTQFISTFGVDGVLKSAAPHSGEEFSCTKFPDYQPVAAEVTADQFLGIK